jgi:ribosomal protein S26
MYRRRMFSKNEKGRAASKYLTGDKGSNSLPREVCCAEITIREWVETT